MPRPFSLDLRERVVAACDAGDSPEDAARSFDVGVRTIYEWLELRKQTGSLAPRCGKTGPKPKLAGHLATLRKLVREKPDATLGELQSQIPVQVGITTVWQALKNMGLSFKEKGHLRGRAASA